MFYWISAIEEEMNSSSTTFSMPDNRGALWKYADNFITNSKFLQHCIQIMLFSLNIAWNGTLLSSLKGKYNVTTLKACKMAWF
jgi:hypothetical protein